MEELLERLIKNGWKPFGDNRCTYHIEYNDYEIAFYRYDYRSDDDRYERIFDKSIRDLVSKESGLWQFVCENELLKPVVDIISICSYSHFTDDHEDCGWDETFPEYRLIESSLKDESELEDFLLNSIKLD